VLDDGIASERCSQARHSFTGPFAQRKDDIVQHTVDDILEHGYQKVAFLLTFLPIPRVTFRAKSATNDQSKNHDHIPRTIRYTRNEGAYVSTTSRSSTLPVGSRGALERTHMGGNIHL
jgi:hypothetical protein